MHDPKIHSAALDYLRGIPGDDRFSRAAVARHLVAFAEEQLSWARESQRTVYSVVYSNYEPAEVSSIWSTQELAQAEADRLNKESDCSMWEVGAFSVRCELPDGGADAPVMEGR